MAQLFGHASSATHAKSFRRTVAVAAIVVSVFLAAWFASVHFVMAPHVTVMRREDQQEEEERRALFRRAGIGEASTADKLFDAMMKDDATYRTATDMASRWKERRKTIGDQIDNVASPYSLTGVCVYVGAFVGTFSSPSRIRGILSFWPGMAEVVALWGIAAFYWLRPRSRSPAVQSGRKSPRPGSDQPNLDWLHDSSGEKEGISPISRTSGDE